MSSAWARAVWPASAVTTCPSQRAVLVSAPAAAARTPAPRSPSPRSAGASTVPAPWVTAASRHRIMPSSPAAPRTALPSTAAAGRPGDGRCRRAGQRAQGQAGAGVVRERRRAQLREDPHHRVRVRRRPCPQRVPAGACRSQDFPGNGGHLRARIPRMASAPSSAQLAPRKPRPVSACERSPPTMAAAPGCRGPRRSSPAWPAEPPAAGRPARPARR